MDNKRNDSHPNMFDRFFEHTENSVEEYKEPIEELEKQKINTHIRMEESEEIILPKKENPKEKLENTDLMEHVHQQFKFVKNKFYYKDQPNTLAFKDNGTKMLTAVNDERVAKAMAVMAQAKGWAAIKVAGHEEFKREVWMEASRRGLKVVGYKPNEQDRQKLEAFQERTMHNQVEQIITRQLSEEQRIQPQHLFQPLPEPNDQLTSIPQTTKQTSPRIYEGKLLDYAADHYKHNREKSMNYFVKLGTPNGVKTIWGVGLEEEIVNNKIRRGDNVQIEYVNNKEVVVQANERNQYGQVINTKMIDAVRNQWNITKTDHLLESVASALIDSKTENPQQRDALKKSFKQELAERSQKGTVPTLHTYDKNVPSKSPHIDLTVLEQERTAERVR